MVMERLDLTGKVVVITGAGRGLGKDMTLAAAKAGAHIVAAARTQKYIDAIAQDVIAMGGGRRAIAVQTDVRESAQVDRLVARAVEEFGRVDVIVANAGIGEGRGLNRPLWEVTDEDWHDNIDVNLSSTFYCARAVAKPMIDQGGGSIITLSSGTAFRGAPHILPYAAAKAGVISLTQSFAIMLARYNIRVNCIIPGEFAKRPSANKEEERHWDERGKFFPAQRVGEPWELGPLTVFLASDASSYITGQGIAVEGGFLSGGYAPISFAPEVAIS
ncbi:MAG: SDR family NAD(P)-dependent oxidoreductase [Dehalococcoidia bacterium]|jgi:NAD(P)-dependent dehydrogenase (short-subunit alcohol dehydrogenase family)